MTNWKAVLRDIAIVFCLTFLGGFVVGLAAAGSQYLPILAIAAANLLFGTVGFIISGCITKVNRFKHMFKVAIGVWLVSLINVAFLGTTLTQWFFGIIFVFIMMGLGGGISFLFVKAQTIQA